MLIAYVDESGDTGPNIEKSTKTYTLGCVLLNAVDWSRSFNDLITLLQRLERTSHARGDEPLLLIHDNGENEAVRKITRRSRRMLTAGNMSGGGYFSHPFHQLIDDPVARSSDQSYFLQLADLVAYSAFRNLYKPSENIEKILNQSMWNNLGSAIFTLANQNQLQNTPGIVERWK